MDFRIGLLEDFMELDNIIMTFQLLEAVDLPVLIELWGGQFV